LGGGKNMKYKKKRQKEEKEGFFFQINWVINTINVKH
jgi:hypothetical protein